MVDLIPKCRTYIHMISGNYVLCSCDKASNHSRNLKAQVFKDKIVPTYCMCVNYNILITYGFSKSCVYDKGVAI